MEGLYGQKILYQTLLNLICCFSYGFVLWLCKERAG